MENQDSRTDLEKYIEYLETIIPDDQVILRMVLTNAGAAGFQPTLALEPEGNVEGLATGATYELILVLNKNKPQFFLDMHERGIRITPDAWYGGVLFQNGKCIMNC
jgi:hypothetical protein